MDSYRPCKAFAYIYIKNKREGEEPRKPRYLLSLDVAEGKSTKKSP